MGSLAGLAAAWLLDKRHEVPPAEPWFQRWRMFFLACSELFAFRGGNEWWVSQYRLAPRAAGVRVGVVHGATEPGSVIEGG